MSKAQLNPVDYLRPENCPIRFGGWLMFLWVILVPLNLLFVALELIASSRLIGYEMVSGWFFYPALVLAIMEVAAIVNDGRVELKTFRFPPRRWFDFIVCKFPREYMRRNFHSYKLNIHFHGNNLSLVPCPRNCLDERRGYFDAMCYSGPDCDCNMFVVGSLAGWFKRTVLIINGQAVAQGRIPIPVALYDHSSDDDDGPGLPWCQVRDAAGGCIGMALADYLRHVPGWLEGTRAKGGKLAQVLFEKEFVKLERKLCELRGSFATELVATIDMIDDSDRCKAHDDTQQIRKKLCLAGKRILDEAELAPHDSFFSVFTDPQPVYAKPRRKSKRDDARMS